MRTRFSRILVVVLHRRGGRRSARGRAHVLAGRDRGRLPARRRRGSVDRLLRPADARPGGDDGLRLQRAVSLGARAGSRRRHVRGHGQRRPGAAGGRLRPRPRVLRRRRAGGPRAGAGAQRRAVRRHLAERQGLPRGRARAARTVFFDPPDPYIWGLAVDRTGNVFAATGDKGLVYKITPAGQGTVFYDTKATHALSLAFDATGAAARRHRHAGAGLPAGRRRQAVRGAGLVLRRDSRAARGRRGHHLRDRRHRTQRRVRRRRSRLALDGVLGRRRWPPCPPRSRRSPWATRRCRSPPARRPPGAGRRARLPAPSSASRPTADRIWCGKSARIRPTTWPSSPTAAWWWPRAARARSSGWPATPTARRSSRAPTRSRSRRWAATAPGSWCSPRRTPASCSGCRARRSERGTYLSEVRDAQTFATWGALKWQALTPGGHEGRAVHAVGQHAHARRDLERLERRLRRARGQPDRQPARALSAVARGPDAEPHRQPAAHVGDGGLSAAQHAAARHVGQHPVARHGVPAAVSERRTRDCRLRRRHPGPPRGGAAAGRRGRRRARSSDGAATNAGC